MKKITILLISCFFISCSNSRDISITRVVGSPSYESAKITLTDTIYQSGEDYTFSFNIENYELGVQTQKQFEYKLANSDKGQHIHFIINNGPYSAKYSDEFVQKLNQGNNVILAFLSRSYHESVKNSNAYYLDQIKMRVKDFRNGFLPCIIIIGLMMSLIIIQPDFSTALIIGSIGTIILFFSFS